MRYPQCMSAWNSLIVFIAALPETRLSMRCFKALP
jgi:hypothetical protein